MKRGPALLALCAMATNGCSFAFVRGPGEVERPPRVFPACTDSLAWPVVDGVMGLFSLAFAASPTAERYDPSTDSYVRTDRNEQLISGLLFAAAYVGGAIYGYSRVSACKEARMAFAASAPPPQPYAPYGYPQPYPPAQPYPYPYPPAQPQQPAPYVPSTGSLSRPPAAGTEGGACLANTGSGPPGTIATCAPGLVCASNLCVRSP